MGEEKSVKKRAVLYVRTSQDSEDTSLKVSIEDQLIACRNLCIANNYQIISEYQDRNRSGRTYPTGSPFVSMDPVFNEYFQAHIKVPKARTRDGLGELFKKLPHVDVLVIRDETRLMRPLLNSYLETYVWQTLGTHKVVVHSVTSGIVSPDNHEHQMLIEYLQVLLSRIVEYGINRNRQIRNPDQPRC